MMMRGRNVLRLNHATMVEVVQAWLNKHTIHGTPKVMAVTYNENVDGCFRVVVECDDETTAQPRTNAVA